MPQTSTAPTESSVVITTETLEKAAQLARDLHSPLWISHSGEQSSGESVARHLDATDVLLDTVGWTRTWTKPSPGQLPPSDPGASAEDMLRQLLAYLRDEDEALHSDGPLTAVDALAHTEGTEHGDTDTRSIALDVLTLLVRALTGQSDAHFAPWEARLHRTHADITALLAAAARFARTYGPGAPHSGPSAD
ncbi:hypothetical protein ABT013_33835 [Streptomyces bacillaris]|uniref:DUF6197 family protein n=1 Tax=Streptomyces bacillaris TaxID=68179 RepID=UPI0033624218